MVFTDVADFNTQCEVGARLKIRISDNEVMETTVSVAGSLNETDPENPIVEAEFIGVTGKYSTSNIISLHLDIENTVEEP